MTFTRRLAGVLSLACCFSLSNAQDITTQTHNISDDGFANVPLQFDFPFYGQSFNNSWMFSNGLISFRDPNVSGLAWSNLSVRQFSESMGSQFDYSIYPLWTDLINIGGTFRTEGSTEFQRYSWLGISPFYDANRLNTFSVEIRPDGKIITNYSLIDVNYASVGIVGNSAAGEYEQIFFSGSKVNTGSLSSWERYTLGVQQPVEDSSQQTFVTETPMVIIVESNTGVEATPIVQSTAQTEQSQSTGSGVTLSSILRIVSREQARLAVLERSTVESSVDLSVEQASQSVEQAESAALNQASSSNSSALDVSQTQEESRSVTAVTSGFSAVDITNQNSKLQTEEQTERKTDRIRQNVADSELAAGVTLASLGTAPQGFQAYSFIMPDSSFYPPKEIYKNQKVIDSPAARGLMGRSDRLHQEMIDAQYK
jgi:hypothetical protein